MQCNKHRLRIHRSNLFKLLIIVVSGPRRQTFISTLIRIYSEINGEGTCKRSLLRGEYMPFVVYGNLLAFDRRPESLEVTVEEQRVEATDRGHLFAEVAEVFGLLFCIRAFGGQAEWGAVVVEGGSGVAKKTPDIH